MFLFSFLFLRSRVLWFDILKRGLASPSPRKWKYGLFFVLGLLLLPLSVLPLTLRGFFFSLISLFWWLALLFTPNPSPPGILMRYHGWRVQATTFSSGGVVLVPVVPHFFAPPAGRRPWQ